MATVETPPSLGSAVLYGNLARCAQHKAESSTLPYEQQPIRIVILALPSASLTGIFGPAEVFGMANSLIGRSVYGVQIVTTKREEKTAFDATIDVRIAISDLDGVQSIDTLLVAGGTALNPCSADYTEPQLLNWLRTACTRTRRFGSLCSGSMVLARAGLLHRKQATTHWSLVSKMTREHPSVEVLPDRIYVKHGNCYTAAGGTSSIDLALALVEEDLGTSVALDVAKHIVLFLRRSGEQPQLSTTLLAQTSPVGSIRNLLIWMADNLDEDLSVAKLARRVAMSERNFSRQFVRQVGKTPGQHVVDLRLEAAQRNLANASLSVSDVARVSGFKSAEVLRRLFSRKFGMSPGRYRNVRA